MDLHKHENHVISEYFNHIAKEPHCPSFSPLQEITNLLPVSMYLPILGVLCKGHHMLCGDFKNKIPSSFKLVTCLSWKLLK